MATSAMVEGLRVGEAVLFSLLAVAAIAQWRRRRLPQGRWLAATFCVLAVATIAHLPSVFPDVGDPGHVVVRRALAALLVLVPYLQYRFVAGFAPPRRWERAVVGSATAAVLAAVLLLPGFPTLGASYTPVFAVLAATLAAYWIVVMGLVAARLWRGGTTESVTVRARMRTLAVGLLALTGGAVVLVLGSSGGRGLALDVTVGVVGLAGAGVLLAGLAPPPSVRTLWRTSEERDSGRVKEALIAATTAREVAQICVRHASKLFGGHGAVLVGHGGTVQGSHGLDPGQARSIAAGLWVSGQSPHPRDHRGGLLSVPCASGWLAVRAGAFTPYFGEEETRRLRSIAALAELALDRVALHDQVHRSSRQLEEARDIAHVGNWEWELDTDTVTWSDELYRMHGLVAQSCGLRFGDVLAMAHPDDRAAVEAVLATACDSGRPFELEHRVVRPDGQVALLQSRGTVVPDHLGRPVRLLGACRDVTVQRQLEAEVAHAALHDPLTDLANRTLFTERASRALARSDARSLAVLTLGLDDFKAVNDSLGHGAGDDLLRAVGVILTRLVGPADTVARLGGDEFGILLEDADTSRATDTAARILEALAQPLLLQGRDVVTQASVGVVIDSDAATVEQLLRNADAALYAAKGGGKNTYRVFEQGMHTERSRRLQLRSDLRQAVPNGELELAFQPLVDLADGAVTGVEALVRWNHPTRGRLEPCEFVPLAEETGLIVEVGDWVLRTALCQLREWHDDLPQLGPLNLHVNVSARQLHEPDVVERVWSLLSGARIDPGRLTVEITESVLLGESDRSVARLRDLRRIGVRVAIDDFGTGYSSLSYLRRLPIDTLKVDKSFVDGVARGPEEEALAHAIVRIAATLHLETVAEGVETSTQAERLLAMGCGTGQGYLYAPPLATSDVVVLLDAHSRVAAAG